MQCPPQESICIDDRHGLAFVITDGERLDARSRPEGRPFGHLLLVRRRGEIIGAKVQVLQCH
jgi:hypothetical protein